MWIKQLIHALNEISPFGLIALALIIALIAVAKL